VIPLLKHADVQVRSRACNVLGAVGGPKSAAALEAILETDQEGWSRAAAEIALRKLTGKSPAKKRSSRTRG
jgi:HEAT repeat protein